MNQVITAFGQAAGLRETSSESIHLREFLPARAARQSALAHGCLAGKDSEWQIRRILVPTDYRAGSPLVIQRAVAIANQCDAALTILNVVDINAASESGSAESLMTRLWNESSTRMAQLAHSLADHVEAQTLLVEGLPSEVIIEKSREFDLVVMGKGRTKPGWTPFGKQTARRVIEKAACPVIIL